MHRAASLSCPLSGAGEPRMLLITRNRLVAGACQAAVGSQVGSGVLWGHSGPLGTARDRSGPLGTARDRSGRLGTARDRSGPSGPPGPLGTARDRSLIARPRLGARLGHLSQPASGWLGCTAGRRGGAAVRRNSKLIMRLAAKTAKSTKETAPRCAAGTPATGQTHHT